MFRKNCGLLHVLLAAVCGLLVLTGSTALADDYYVYGKFNAPAAS
jgi:hypothetical protein